MEITVLTNPYKILTPIVALPRLGLVEIITLATEVSRETLLPIVEGFDRADPREVLALDVETKGNDISDPESRVVGVGLADKRGSIYFEVDVVRWKLIVDLLIEYRIPLVGHNVNFDGGYVYRDSGNRWANWVGCTFGMMKHFASEGFLGQRWGLKNAQVELLGWPESNEAELDGWLVANGFTKQSGVPDKAQMHRAPAEILGKYCCLDADSTYLLYREVFVPVLEYFSRYTEYHLAFLQLVRMVVQAQLGGMLIDVPRMQHYCDELSARIAEALADFYGVSKVAAAVAEFNRLEQESIQAAWPEERPRFKKKPERTEPTQYNKDGTVSKNWTRWKELESLPLEFRADWLKYQEKVEAAKSTNFFNPNSQSHKAWLFYTSLGYPVESTTDSGDPSTDYDSLLGFGPTGKLLIRYNELKKEQEYVAACLATVRGLYLHARYKTPGTLTGRLSGDRGFNMQQQPKTQGYLECFVARGGEEDLVWVDCDHSSIEPIVLSEFSEDPSMLRLFGKESRPNDVYLYTGAFIKGLRERIVASGYNPLSPSRESIAAAKKNCKHERQVAKTVYLAASYGAGPGKIQNTLRLDGVSMSLAEVKTIHSDFWKLYGGIKKWEQELLAQYQQNGGWILNGLGRPIAIDAGYTKDIVNRFIQSTAHDIHIIYVSIVEELLTRDGIIFKYIIPDWHDQLIVEVPRSQADAAKQLLGVEAYEHLNAFLEFEHCLLKGDANVVTNLAQAKCEQ